MTMKADGVLVTWISAKEQIQQRDRHGFIDVCGYGSNMEVHRNEVGCIATLEGHPTILSMMPFLCETPVRVSERIFVVEPEAARSMQGRFRHQKGKDSE